MSGPIIQFQEVSLAFGTSRILRKLSLDIHEKESFVLLGRSGSGKSVLLKCLLRLLSFQSGNILWEGQDVWQLSSKTQQDLRKRSGVVFQGSALFDSLSIWENIAFVLLQPPSREHPQNARKRALKMMDRVGLASKTADLLPDSLSGGMKRRVAFARAILLDPAFLFLDEPTAGLDPVFSRLIGRLIVDLQKDLKATTLTITHDLALAHTIAHNVGVLHNGKLAWKGPPASMKRQTKPEVKELTPTQNTSVKAG